MVGIARSLAQSNIQDCEALQKRYRSLLSNDKFITAVEAGTASEENVNRRITLATQAFADAE